MSKMITPAELAGIVATLLVAPSSLGELEEQTTYVAFIRDIAEVVANYCGGDVGSVSTPEENDNGEPGSATYLVAIRADGALPDLAKNAWAASDPDGFHGEVVEGLASPTFDAIKAAQREAKTAIDQTLCAIRTNGTTTVPVGPSDRHREHPLDRPMAIAIDDQRISNGQVVLSIRGNRSVDDLLKVAAEVDSFGPVVDGACLHIHFDDDRLAFSIFKHGRDLLVRPEVDVAMTTEHVSDQACWRIQS